MIRPGISRIQVGSITTGVETALVGTATTLHAGRSGVRVPAKDKIFFSPPKCSAWLWGPPHLLFNGNWGFFHGLKPPKRRTDYSPPSSAEVKMTELCRYSNAVMDNFTFLFYLFYITTSTSLLGWVAFFFSTVSVCMFTHTSKTTAAYRYSCKTENKKNFWGVTETVGHIRFLNNLSLDLMNLHTELSSVRLTPFVRSNLAVRRI